MTHYFTKDPQTPLKAKLIQVNLRGNDLVFETGSAVFSPDRIDIGSRLLIENAVIEPSWKILDLGCAYGAVGISIAKAYPGTEVVMTDINERAVTLCRRNIRQNQVRNSICVVGNIYEPVSGEFDTILLNPPIHAGKAVCVQMIKESFQHLKAGGMLQLVARHHKGGASLQAEMKDVFGNCVCTAKQSGFRIYLSRKES